MLLGRLRGADSTRICAVPNTHLVDTSLRPTGIHVLGSVPWSAHICLFYQTKDDLLDAVLTYLSAGWSNNEACLWVVSAPINVGDAERALARALPDLNSRLATGGIEIFDAHAWYLRGSG